MPWWQSALYLKGLEDQGIIGDKNRPPGDRGAGSPGKSAPKVDYAEDPFLPKGFKTRRAG